MIMRIITVYVMIIIQSFVKIDTPVVEAIHTDIYTHMLNYKLYSKTGGVACLL